jgi:hypothetical protein
MERCSYLSVGQSCHKLYSVFIMTHEEHVELAFRAAWAEGFRSGLNHCNGSDMDGVDRDERWQIYKFRHFGTYSLNWKLPVVEVS